MAATQVQIRRNTAADLLTATPVEGELGVDTTNWAIVVGDGSTLGGRRQASEAYVAAQIAALAAGVSNNLYLQANCT